MSSPTTNCTRCGAVILAATAERTHGLCRPCERGWRNPPPSLPYSGCVNGHLTFTADRAGTQHYPDVIATGVSCKDLSHYVLLSRTLPIGSPSDNGVHVEVDDQINSGFNCVTKCTLSLSTFHAAFSTPIDPGREVQAVTVTLAVPLSDYEVLSQALALVFEGHEPLLTIDHGA